MRTSSSRVARRLGAGAVAALVPLLGACGSTSVSRHVSFVESGGRTRFNAGAITVTKGDTLKLIVGNLTPTLQDFTVDALRIERTVKPDETVEVDLKPPRSGTYLLYSRNDRSVSPVSIVVPQ
jgi:hypothetical protein